MKKNQVSIPNVAVPTPYPRSLEFQNLPKTSKYDLLAYQNKGAIIKLVKYINHNDFNQSCCFQMKCACSWKKTTIEATVLLKIARCSLSILNVYFLKFFQHAKRKCHAKIALSLLPRLFGDSSFGFPMFTPSWCQHSVFCQIASHRFLFFLCVRYGLKIKHMHFVRSIS